jgi:hypothetical protein
MLAKLLSQDFLARGERGELIVRLLWTLAHDAAINEENGVKNPDSQLIYHQPVRFLDWLKALVAPRWHPVVLKAKPIANPDGLTLEEAFRDVYLHFSHFARADDYKIICPQLLWISLTRGYAYQCADNQKATDLVAGLHHGGLKAPICAENTSPMNGQVKNRVTPSDVLVNPHVGGTPINNLPTFSIVHDVGLQENNVYPHPSLPAKFLRGDNRTPNIHIRHYQIHIEGCSHETYGVIPKESSEIYKLLLSATKLGHDFPRNEFPENRAALIRLKPAFSAREAPSSLDWVDDAVSTFSPVGKGKRKAKADALVDPSFLASDTASDVIMNPVTGTKGAPQLTSLSGSSQPTTTPQSLLKRHAPQSVSSSGASGPEKPKKPRNRRK